MKYSIPELDIAMFDGDIGTESMSRVTGAGNAAAQELEKSSNSSTAADTRVFKFIWE